MMYYVGDKPRLTVTFTSGGVPVDPDALTVKVRNPANEVTTYVYGVDAEVVRDSIGVYHVDVSVDRSGTWRHRWEGTGSNQAAGESSFEVEDSYFD